MSTYRLFPATNGPAAPASYSGPFLAGVMAEVTAGGVWLDGYWWWVCPTGQSTAAQKFALWQRTGAGGTLISGSVVTSGVLTPGQWNYVPLAAPLPLAPGACYCACTGWSTAGTTGFPSTSAQFGTSDPYAAGITAGPLQAFSDQSGTAPGPFSTAQGVFSTAGTDPSASMPATGSSSSNFWMDLQADTTAPAGATYRLWPNYPVPAGPSLNGIYTLATEITLAQACTLDNIWFYSPPGAAGLPARTGVWDVATQTEIPACSNTSPAWSGAAGSGWVSLPVGVQLPAGTYKPAVFRSDNASNWFIVLTGYWSTGPGANGITSGPVSAPDNAAASPGQASYNSGTWAYPDTTAGSGENYYLDSEWTPAAAQQAAASWPFDAAADLIMRIRP